MAIKKSEIPEIIRYEGVDSKGFGRVAKLVMTDSKLEIGAKAVYAYLCSYAGSENAAYPHRDKIFADLKMCKTTYYTHLNNLIKSGYIRVERKDVYPFSNNYIIVSRPSKMKAIILETDNSDTLTVKGINSFGYGTIPKLVMLDERLSYKSKAIYAYFCSFAGNGTIAFPKRSDILHHLDISLNTFQNHIKDLIKYNYIEIEHRHVQGRFASNNYILIDLPDEDVGQQEIDKRAMYQAEVKQKKEQKKQGLVNLPTTVKQPVVSLPKRINPDDIEDKPLTDYETIIKSNIEYEYLKSTQKHAEYIDLIVDVMVDAVNTKSSKLRVNKQDISSEIVKSRLLKLNETHIEYVIDRLGSISTMPKNLRAYLLTALYNSFTGIDPYYTLQVQHDFKKE